LFYRLAVFCVHLPRLEERADDVMPLARHFLHVVAQRGEGDAPALSGGAIRKLMDHRWPGNVRELQLVVERACILADGENEIRPEHICFPRVEHLSTADRAVEGVAV
jgi:DNA-binding NtrC family response regulator